uniref:Integrase n=1 Tax=candidate division WOR-3 bacterium TaxID=2052148 RepID=A0A7C6EDY2_UNCW3
MAVKRRYMHQLKPDTSTQAQRIFQVSLSEWVQSFLTDCKVKGLTSGTISFYRRKLTTFCDFSTAQMVTRLDEVDADHLRRFFLWLEENHHNPGGRHTFFRTLRAFFYWVEAEEEGYRSPLRKLKAPKVPIEPIEGATLDDLTKLLATCDNKTFVGKRDYALLLILYDTAIRIRECLSLTWNDIHLDDGAIQIKKGKNNKPRIVFFSTETRRALRSYAKSRHDDVPYVWVTAEGQPLTYWGVISLLKRRAKEAGLSQTPSPHDFRRGSALTMLRNGADVVSVSRLLGHSGLQVTLRYLAQTETDLKTAHDSYSPINFLKNKSGQSK